MGDQVGCRTEMGMKERDDLGKGDRFYFGKCSGPVGHPRGWIYGTGLRRKIGVGVGYPGRFEIYR